MKKINFLSFVFILFIVVGCSKDEEGIIGEWNLLKITGGFAGVNCDYNEGDITWTFDEENLVIENNLTGSDICINISQSGNTPYSILEANGNSYLLLDSSESGQITITGDELTLDQNKQSGGTGADGFIMSFKRD